MKLVLLMFVAMFLGCAANRAVVPAAATAPSLRAELTIHVQKDAAQRAIDEGVLMELLRQDFQNMDMSADHVDLKLRRQMDAVMKRLMSTNQWVEP